MRGVRTEASSDDRGSVTIQYVWGVALSLVFLVVAANLIAFQYGRGVVRGALDEGVRAGSRAAAGADECRTRAQQVLDQLLGGPLGDGVVVACHDAGDRVVASADGTFVPWIGVLPDHRFRVEAVAVKERP